MANWEIVSGGGYAGGSYYLNGSDVDYIYFKCDPIIDLTDGCITGFSSPTVGYYEKENPSDEEGELRGTLDASGVGINVISSVDSNGGETRTITYEATYNGHSGRDTTVVLQKSQTTGGGTGGGYEDLGNSYDNVSNYIELVDNLNNTFTIKTKAYYESYSNHKLEYVKYSYTRPDDWEYTVSNWKNNNTWVYTCEDSTELPDFYTDNGGKTFSLPEEESVSNIYVEVKYKNCYTFYNGSSVQTITYIPKGRATISVKHYKAPIFPENATPTITTSSGKLTLKKPWVLSWPEAEPVNLNSLVKGYFIHLKNVSNDPPTFVNLKAASTLEPVPGYDGTTWYCIPESDLTIDSESNLVSISIDPKESGIIPGNNYVLDVGAYTQFGDGNSLRSNNYISSDEYTAKNNGILRVRVGNEWKEGQVYVKTPTGWKESEGVYVKTTDGWKESQ